MHRLNRLHVGLFLGVLLGLAYAAWPPRLAAAQATMCFSPRVKLPRYIEPQPKTAKETPLSWAEGILYSKGAINFLCVKFERSQLDNRVEIVRSACLLISEKRVQVEAYQDNCLRLRVQAEKPEIALLLCQNLLGYLGNQSKQVVEQQAQFQVDKVETLEQQLRVLEKSLGSQLWLELAIDAKARDAADRQVMAADLLEFERQVQEYRDAFSQRFYGEIQAATEVPTFTVIEPSYVVVPQRPWVPDALYGGLAGILVSALIQLGQRRRRGTLPLSREPWVIRRKPSP